MAARHCFPDIETLAERVNARFPGADALLAELTCWPSVRDLALRERRTGFFPSCRHDLDPRWSDVAAIFDAVMEGLGDDRRAIVFHRGAA